MKNILVETRSNAKAAGRKTYYTGKECKNGHTAYRYVDSGTCSECINGSNRKAKGNTTVLWQHETNPERQYAIGQLIPLAVCVHSVEVPMARDAAAALCLARFPCLTLADVTLNKPPQKWEADVPKNHYLVPVQDVDAMRAIEKALEAKHKPDMSVIRKRLYQLAEDANKGDESYDYNNIKNT